MISNVIILVMLLLPDSVINKDDTVITEKGSASVIKIYDTLNQQTIEMYHQQKKISNLELEIKSFQSLHSKEQSEIKELQAKLNSVEKLLDKSQSKDGGVTYIRWGRNICPGSATVVYKGNCVDLYSEF